MSLPTSHVFFFFNDTATTEIYTLSLHDALPISQVTVVSPTQRSANPPTSARSSGGSSYGASASAIRRAVATRLADRKSTRLNSSHLVISYAVFCLKKKK